MPAAMKVEIKGMDKLRKAMQQAPEMYLKEVHNAFVQSIAAVRRDVLPRTPYKTGMLRQSITRGISIQKLTASIGSDLIYAWPQHEGNFFHPKGGERHYLLNATKAQLSNINTFFQTAAKNIANAIVNKTK